MEKIRAWHLGNTSRGVCSDLSGLPNILNWARFLQSSPRKLWYLPDVPLPWGPGLRERGWPATTCFNTAERKGKTMLSLCFWMFPALSRKFCWEILAKATGDLCRRHREEGCRERFSGMATRARALAQARAEAPCLLHGSNPHPRARKPLPFLSSCLKHGLQKAYVKKQGVVAFFIKCCMHARNRL